MGLNEEYASLDATDLAELVRQRQVSPVELIDVAAARLEQVEPTLAGMTEWTLEQARQAAHEPLREAPFAGVPFLLKDNLHFAAGLPYHNGSRIWRGWVPPRDSEMVRRFRAAGLIILGSTKVPELSLSPVTEPRLFGRANNPWAVDRTTGGSSGGSCAPWRPGPCRWLTPRTEAAPSAFLPPAAASSGSSPAADERRTALISVRAGTA